MSLVKTVDLRATDHDAFLRTLRDGRALFHGDVADIVARILKEIEKRGAQALIDNVMRFDAPDAKNFKLWATDEEIDNATVDAQGHQAIRDSIARVTKFHEAQLKAVTGGWERKDDGWHWRLETDGGFEGQRMVPIRSAGVYVPGGKATYPSSVIMNSVPAKVAGVEQITIATPVRSDGSLSDSVLVAAREVGIRHILKVGGAAAIGALALGFDEFDGVDVVVGPGNVYVNEAKRQLWGQVGLDGYAGPSEVCVLVDDTSNPEFAAADLLTQVEHSEDNVGFLVSLSENMLQAVLEAAERQLTGSPREKIMRAALRNYGMAVVVPDLETAAAIIDSIAPEHLSVMVEDPALFVPMIRNSGCILLGSHTPQSAGDFVSGPSHTLPTAGAARFGSPVSVLNFLKVQSIGNLGPEDLRDMLSTIEAFGDMEGFPAHAAGAAIRFANGH